MTLKEAGRTVVSCNESRDIAHDMFCDMPSTGAVEYESKVAHDVFETKAPAPSAVGLRIKLDLSASPALSRDFTACM